MKIKAGISLYHGTDADFDEECDGLQGPAWLSSSIDVAEYFAKRSGGWGAEKRVIEYRLIRDIDLPDIYSVREMQDFAEKHGICLAGVEDMKETVEASGIPGWVLPNNYPNGDDILIVDTGFLEYVSTVKLEPALTMGMRPI